MPAFLRKYSNFVLDALAVLFLAIVVIFAVYGASIFADQAQRAFSALARTGNVASFDLQGAAALDLHGL